MNSETIIPVEEKYLCFYYQVSPEHSLLEYPKSNILQVNPKPLSLKEGYFVALREYLSNNILLKYHGIHFKRYRNGFNDCDVGFLIPNPEVYLKLSNEGIPNSIKDYLNGFGVLDYFKRIGS